MGMWIECMTTSAAADVLFLLLGAHLIPGGAFSVRGPWPPGTPIHFTLSMAPAADLVEQLPAIPDSTIVEKGAT